MTAYRTIDLEVVRDRIDLFGATGKAQPLARWRDERSS